MLKAYKRFQEIRMKKNERRNFPLSCFVIHFTDYALKQIIYNETLTVFVKVK